MSPRAASNFAGLQPFAIAEQPQTPLRRAVRHSLTMAGVATVLTAASEASPTGRSIAIHFASDEPTGIGSIVDAAAGVLNTVKWNNFTLLSSASPQALTVDLNSGSIASTATVVWSSNNTWSSTGKGEENNTAPAGDNRDLMAGYLDTGGLGGTGVMINVTGLNGSGFSLGYDVYVYIQGGVNFRGGDYTLGAVTNSHTGDSAFNGTFIEDTDLPGTTPGSNYMVFRNVIGDGFTLTGTPLVGNPARAPINGIEIRAIIPEPTSVAALVGGVGVLLGWRRPKDR